MKRIAIYVDVPEGTDPSEVLDNASEDFELHYDLDPEWGNITIYDPAPKEGQ